jgi:hypothetical protein
MLESCISTFGRKWDNAVFWFSSLCYAAQVYFTRKCQISEYICPEPHQSCSWVPNINPTFPKIVADGHSTLQYSGGECVFGEEAWSI